MKKVTHKTIGLIFFHMLVITLTVLAFFKFPEETIKLKADIYYLLQTSKADSKIDFTDYPSIAHTENGWYQDVPLIYHAAGGIDGLDYTNSKEALEQMLAKENYFIEIDFMYTSDHELICMHEWENQWGSEELPTLAEFTAGKIYGKYTTLTAKELIQYMEQYKDLHIIIDTKEDNQIEIIESLVNLSAYDTNITDRFIIQLYTDGVKAKIQEVYPFQDNNFLFTVYKFGARFPNKIMKICYDENISVVTVPYNKWDDETRDLFLSKGFVIYEHTINRPDLARTLMSKGVHGFYTDFLSEEDLYGE